MQIRCPFLLWPEITFLSGCLQGNSAQVPRLSCVLRSEARKRNISFSLPFPTHDARRRVKIALRLAGRGKSEAPELGMPL